MTTDKIIQKNYPRMRPSEKKVADFFLDFKGEAESLKLDKLAQVIEVSQPTIVRFAKSLGYASFKELKNTLIREKALESNSKSSEAGFFGYKITEEDDLGEIPGKIVTSSIKVLEETVKCVDGKQYKKAVNAILEANHIVIYGVENSIGVATDLLTKLLYLGVNCTLHTDYYFQNVSANNLKEGDLAIGVTYTGYSKDTISMMKIAKRGGAKTLVITNVKDAKIKDYSDIILHASNEQYLYGNTIFSRIAQTAIVDMLYAGVLKQDYSERIKALNKNSRAIENKTYKE